MKYFAVCIAILSLILLVALVLEKDGRARGAGIAPYVGRDMNCTVAGQSLQYDGTSIVCSPPTLPSSTVASLPTCNSASKGVQYLVTDALLPAALANVAGSGAVVIAVTCTGTNWIVS